MCLSTLNSSGKITSVSHHYNITWLDRVEIHKNKNDRAKKAKYGSRNFKWKSHTTKPKIGHKKNSSIILLLAYCLYQFHPRRNVIRLLLPVERGRQEAADQ